MFRNFLRDTLFPNMLLTGNLFPEFRSWILSSLPTDMHFDEQHYNPQAIDSTNDVRSTA